MLAIAVLILSAVILITIFLFFILYSIDFFLTFNKAPFIPTSKNVLSGIIELLDIKDDSVVYDLGCGDGRVLLECYRHNSKARYLGIEKSSIPYILARIKTKGIDKIKILHGDFFKRNLSQATNVFLYLLPKMMDSLLPKLEMELKQGTVLVSFNFAFSKKKPEKVIKVEMRNKSGLLYVYRF